MRGFNPAPGTFTFYQGKRISLISAEAVSAKGTPGEVIDVSNEGIKIATGNGAIMLKAVKPEGRGIMAARDFANGNRISRGVRFGN